MIIYILPTLLLSHFDINCSLCEELMIYITSSPEWNQFKDKEIWNNFMSKNGPLPDVLYQNDLIFWLTPHINRYLKLKAFL